MRLAYATVFARTQVPVFKWMHLKPLFPKIFAADVISWAMPVYYMTMTAQLKALIDYLHQLERMLGLKGGKRYVLFDSTYDPRPGSVYRVD